MASVPPPLPSPSPLRLQLEAPRRLPPILLSRPPLCLLFLRHPDALEPKGHADSNTNTDMTQQHRYDTTHPNTDALTPISGRLAKIENEKEFPARERNIASVEYENYGQEMANILPKYFEAVQDHHRL